MNLTLLGAEWRAVRRASLRLMQHSLSMVGLFSVTAVAIVAMHPQYAHAVGRWIVPQPDAPSSPKSTIDPIGASLAQPGSEASRMLGLVESAAVQASDDVAPAAAMASTAGSTTASASPPANVAAVERPGTAREKRDAANYLAKKYHVNVDAVALLVDAAYTTGHELDLDPLLLLSVIGVESGFNPFAESNVGASGLMQLMAKVHRDKLGDFGGAHIALNPVVNLRVGAVVLKDCIRRGGSLADGLRLYVGAGNNAVDGGYGARVLQEKDRLAQAVRGIAHARIEPIPAPPVKVRARQPGIDHSLDTVEPTDAKIDSTQSVAAL